MIGIRKTGRVIAFMISLFFLLLIGNPLHAQTTAIDDGVAWLEANQDASGLWGVDKQTPYRDAAVVVEVLSTLDADSAIVADGLSALESMSTTSTDYLARKIIAMATGGSTVSAYLLDSLAGMQNDDGGWGYQEGYAGNNLETALAMRALWAGLYTDMAVLGAGGGFLQTSQNADSGWSFVAGDSSRVFFTAHAVLALDALSGSPVIDALIEGGANWLKAQAHPDGGFGTGGSSNPYETGLAMMAIIKGDPAATEILDAMTYLESTQLPNGSWNDDAYSTAMAIYGLNHIGPDLFIATADISLSNPTPSDSEVVIIAAIVRNGGIQSADTILVQVFDGHPDAGGLQIGTDATISTLAPGGDSTIHVDWNTLGLAGDHDIYVLVDPLNEIREPSKLNNTAVKPVHVYFPPDLLIDDDGIVFDPPEPDACEAFTIRTIVKNVGELTALSVPLQVWNGDPDAGGTPLMTTPFIIPSIPHSSQITFNLNIPEDYFCVPGPYEIHACVDMDNAIREISESNNCNFDTVWIGLICRSADLATSLNLLGLPTNPIEAQSSYDMIPALAGCNEIDGWNRSAQMWMSAIDIGGGMIIGEDFPIGLLDGFFARVTGESLFESCGQRVSDHHCTQLEQGLNIVSVPNEDACYTGYTLIEDITDCVEGHTWDASLQMWLSAIDIGGMIIGDDFSVTPGHGYFVKVNTVGEWCTRTCDTITNLPDLVVTPAYIGLDPNPVVWGGSVFICMGVLNAGLDSAFMPRIDMYVNDPDLPGATKLFEYYIPDTLGPGEATLCWGANIPSNLIVPSPGTYPIFGIADMLDEIAELDEANNRASQNLTVLPAAAAPESQPDPFAFSMIDSDEAITALDQGKYRWWTEPIPEPEPSDQIVTETSSGPETKGITPATSAGSASRIENVLIGNVSSSSITITWFTDELSGGCVNYGTTPSLGISKCESVGASRMHIVVLDHLAEGTRYYIEIESGGITDNNFGELYSVTTATAGAGIPYLLYGTVITEGTNAPASEVICSGILNGNNGETHKLLGQIDSSGIWILNLGNLKAASSGEMAPYQVGDTVHVKIYGSDDRLVETAHVIDGSSPQDCGAVEIESAWLCGDIDGSRELDISDIVLLVNYIFNSDGSGSSVLVAAGDVNCTGGINISDVVYMVNYFFANGPIPCQDCP